MVKDEVMTKHLEIWIKILTNNRKSIYDNVRTVIKMMKLMKKSLEE